MTWLNNIASERFSGLTLIIFAAILWGTVTVGVKILYQLGQTTPLTVGWLRLTIAAPALYLLGVVITGQHPFVALGTSIKVWGLLFLAALTMAAYQITLFAALTRTNVTAGVVLAICSAPIFAGVLAWLFLGERPTGWMWVSMFGAIVGTILLSNLTHRQDFLSGDYFFGNLLALGAGLSYAGYSLVARGLVGRVKPWSVITLSFLGGSLLLLPLLIGQGFLAQFGPLGWAIIFYLGLIPTALAYILYIFGLKTTLASVATTAALVEPLTASLLAISFLGERLTWQEGGGAVILLGAMVLLYRKSF